MKCKYYEKCNFIKSIKSKNEMAAKMFISKYCNNNVNECAIYIFAEKKSINEIPNDLKPFNLNKIKNL